MYVDFILQARLASATAYSLSWHCPASTRFLWLIVAAEPWARVPCHPGLPGYKLNERGEEEIYCDVS